ncbi:FKBP-type peptidyl-prolyl cis-trans isomerase [Hyalangium sp.]|uniref:FKBP-type peptidyl-prolyl cis-trans isomerase n=1 Tax=Hyalangium sp. TaxID=2028555 RepID=UPI002D3A8FF8|nr:FKBP-type peptidyl-prolyl cis-trans isomerase [Hyalangium sp.]HYH95174.1 FKBP-type peptidyl-prolyl cis-trans isomerase [Hyalangium sp.]
MLRCLMFSVLLLSLGCGEETNTGDPALITYAPALGVDLTAMERRESGLYLQDVRVGTGDEATRGRQVTVDYTGWLPSGTQFDSSRSAGRAPFSFTPGQGRVIDGWEEGVVGMKVGGLRKLVIPSALAYGAQGRNSIPPHSVLIFDIELLSVP